MRTYEGPDFASVYDRLLYDLHYNPDYECAPRDQTIKEIINVSLKIDDPMKALYSNERRGSQTKYIAAELLWYFSGRNDLSYIEKHAKFWTNIVNSDGTLNSAYGHLLFTKKNFEGYSQWEWAYESLKNDKDTRQALMHFNMPEHQYKGNKDFVCTLTGLFHIRNNKLHFTVQMRSNDAILGAPTDIAFFSMLQQQMCKLLKEDCYPELELGSYTHVVGSMHVYERHFQLLREMLLYKSNPIRLPAIGINLVDKNGTTNHQIINMMESEESRETIPLSDDPTLRWISLHRSNLNKNTEWEDYSKK